MKKISKILLSSALCSSLAYGVTFEYPQLYKDQKTMAMGGAAVSTGGTATSLFSNPAGLSKIPKQHGWEVNILDINLSVSDSSIDFFKDIEDIDDSLSEDQKSAETLKILEKNLGENININLSSSVLNIAKHFDKYAFALMPIAGANINLIPHRGNGTDGVLEANGLAYGGVALGVSRKLDDINIGSFKIQNVNVGLGLKGLQFKTINTNLDVATIVDNKDDLADYLLDEESDEGSSVVADLGVQAEIFNNIDVGLSVMNIGSIGNANTVEIPMTVNAGLSYTLAYPKRVFFDKTVLAADYIDIFEGYEQDGDPIKRTRLGLNSHVVSGWLGSFSLQAGLYQGYPTYGADLRFSVVKIGYTSYAEEVGPKSGKQEDRRHLVSLSIGW